jgi:prepilin-type processing-associated H-X9-DG protein
MFRRRRGGFTWVELVVCVAIVLFLLALLLPAVRQARTPGKSNVCSSHLHQLGLAMMNYVSSGGQYPGYLQPLTLDSPAKGVDSDVVGSRRVSWVVPILPMLERTDVYRAFRNGRFPEEKPADAADAQELYMNWLVCPSNPPQSRFPPPCSYAVNTGQVDVPAVAGDQGQEGYPCDWRANGVFFNRFIDGEVNPAGAPRMTTTQDFIAAHDGTSNTLLASERLDGGSWAFPPAGALDAEAALGFVWRPSPSSQPPFKPPLPSQRINGPADPLPINNARPSSNHPGGVMVVFCDGHSRFLSEEIDYGVYCLLMTPDGLECNAPGQTKLVPPSPANNYKYLRTEQLGDCAVE